MTIEEIIKESEEETIKMAKYMIATQSSIRRTAEVYKISRASVKYRIDVILKRTNPEYCEKVRQIVQSHLGNKRGGKRLLQNLMVANTHNKIDKYIYKTLVKNKDKEWVVIKTHEIAENAEVAVNSIARHMPTILKDSFCRYERRKIIQGSIHWYEYRLKIDKELV